MDDFLAACVCIFKTGLELFRIDADEQTLGDPSCWVLDQGLRFEPDLHNFDHHQTDEKICSLTMVLDHFYGKSYREYLPQLTYIEIHDSHGSQAAAKFAGLNPSGVEIASSLVQNLVLKSFSEIEGLVSDPFYSIMLGIGDQLCRMVEEVPLMMEALDRSAELVSFEGLDILDIVNCDVESPDRLPTKFWCKKRGIFPAVILTRDTRSPGKYRMIGIDKSKIDFSGCKSCDFVHPSGFMAVFDEYDTWKIILAETKKAAQIGRL